jgi:hypothetical protein
VQACRARKGARMCTATSLNAHSERSKFMLFASVGGEWQDPRDQKRALLACTVQIPRATASSNVIQLILQQPCSEIES